VTVGVDDTRAILRLADPNAWGGEHDKALYLARSVEWTRGRLRKYLIELGYVVAARRIYGLACDCERTKLRRARLQARFLAQRIMDRAKELVQ